MERLAHEAEKESQARGGAASKFAVEYAESGVVAACEVVVVPARSWGRNGRSNTVKAGK